jgi:hypothetical protein
MSIYIYIGSFEALQNIYFEAIKIGIYRKDILSCDHNLKLLLPLDNIPENILRLIFI